MLARNLFTIPSRTDPYRGWDGEIEDLRPRASYCMSTNSEMKNSTGCKVFRRIVWYMVVIYEPRNRSVLTYSHHASGFCTCRVVFFFFCSLRLFLIIIFSQWVCVCVRVCVGRRCTSSDAVNILKLVYYADAHIFLPRKPKKISFHAAHITRTIFNIIIVHSYSKILYAIIMHNGIALYMDYVRVHTVSWHIPKYTVYGYTNYFLYYYDII